MNVRERYEEFRFEYGDITPTPWEKLTPQQQLAWARLFAAMDNEQKAASKAMETIGRIVVSNPEMLPILEV